MGRLGVLGMARFLTTVFPAVEFSLTGIGAFKKSGPPFHRHSSIRCKMRLAALDFGPAIRAEDVLGHLATIATSRNADVAGTACPLVAWPFAFVNAA